MKLNPHIFFQLKEGKIIAWDYFHHQQFILEKEEFERLILYSQDKPFEEQDQEFLAHHLLTDTLEENTWGADVLAEIFHLGTCDVFEQTPLTNPEDFIKEYIQYCEKVVKTPLEPSLKHEGQTVALPQPNLELLKEKNFWQVLRSRKTCRDFYGTSISQEVLSTLLFISFGFVHEGWEEFKKYTLPEVSKRKTSPSGGGLHPIEVYVFIYHVEGVRPGLYYYNATSHTLVLLKLGDFEDQLISILANQYYAKGLSVGIFLTADFQKAWWKYPHSRGYRNVLYDLGHLSQTFLLSATALELQTWLTGAFHDSSIAKLLNVGPFEKALFFVGCGKGSGNAFDQTLLKALIEK